MKFTKMHGIGNDYIYLFDNTSLDFSEFSRTYSNVHTGIGSDGVIHITPATGTADFSMDMYNADGSQGKMCGNGIRCVGKYLYDHHITTKTTLNINTASGIRQIVLHLNEENKVERVTVDMGAVLALEEKRIELDGLSLVGTFVSVGNPHFVIECNNPHHIPLELWGKQIEAHTAFAPEGVNVEFYRPTRGGFEFRVWERGSGETQACGTGACACFAAALHHGRIPNQKNIATLLGGKLELWQDGTHIKLCGSATTVYHGELPEPLLL